MRNFPGVVLFQSGTQIVRDADIEVLGIDTFQNVDVFMSHAAIGAVETAAG